MFDIIPYAARRMMRDPFAEFENMFWNQPNLDMKIDISDQGDSYKLEADLPGFKKEDIKIDLDKDRMTISAERKNETEEKGENGYIRRERVYGSFSRSFDVSSIDTAAIGANYTDGVLTLTLPKKQAVQPASRQIEIL